MTKGEFRLFTKRKEKRNVRQSIRPPVDQISRGAAGMWPMTTSARGKGGYSIPTMAPLFGPPPYEYRDSWIMAIMFKTTPEVLKGLIPRPLVPNPNDIMFVLIERLFATGLGNYNEFILGAPAIFEEEQVNYCVFLMVDTDISMAVGREIWGFPKKLGQLNLEEKNGIVTGTVERGGTMLVKGTMELSALGKSNEAPRPFVNLKLIPSVKKNAPPDVMQLTSTALENYKFHRMYKGKATLEFGTSPENPFHDLPIKEILGGSYINSDSTLTYGQVIYDYLKAK
jgi:acetoacetate decarboxylase